MYVPNQFLNRANGVTVPRWRIFDTSTVRYVQGPNHRTRVFLSLETCTAAIRRLERGPVRQSARVRTFERVR